MGRAELELEGEEKEVKGDRTLREQQMDGFIKVLLYSKRKQLYFLAYDAFCIKIQQPNNNVKCY